MTPGDLRENDTLIVPFGMGFLSYAHLLRSGNFYNKNYDFCPISNPLTGMEVINEESFKNFLKIKDLY